MVRWPTSSPTVGSSSGSGAEARQMQRLETPLEESRAKFDESLEVLLRLLTEYEVEHHGEYFLEPITIMPLTVPRRDRRSRR